jgi:hypothetical protein
MKAFYSLRNGRLPGNANLLFGVLALSDPEIYRNKSA